jgi:hypothetical protein
MTKNVSQHDMRVQRAIEADAKMREIAKKSVHWPDPDKPRGERKPLPAIHVGPDGKRLVDSPKVQEAAE